MGFDLANDPKKANISIGLLTFLCSLLAVSFIGGSMYISIGDLNGESFQCVCNDNPQILCKAEALSANHFWTWKYDEMGHPTKKTQLTASFKHVPIAFFFIGASFLAAICLNQFLETGTIQRLIGTYRGMEAKEEVRMEMAAALFKSVSKINTCSLCCYLILMHLLPVLHTGLIAYNMSAFVHVELDPFTLFHTQQLLYTSYLVPVQNRSDVLLDLFPRNTVYEYNQYGPSGTYINVDVYCTQATASVLELTYLILLYLIVLFWYIMIINKIVVSNYLLVFGCFYARGSNLKLGSRILLSMIKKNIDNLLMAEIIDLSYAKNIQIT